MSKVIQMVVIDDDNSLFIIGYRKDFSELTFRVSFVPEQLQVESITFGKGMAYTNLYHFSVDYLNKFIEENKI